MRLFGWEGDLPEALRRAGRSPRFHLLFVALFVYVGYCEAAAIDFGVHWDEHIILMATQRSLNSGLFLPQRYNYPSVVFTLPYLVLLPDIASQYLAGVPLSAAKQTLAQVVGSKEFTLHTRMLFVLVTELAMFWVYLLAWRLGRSGWEALAAAAMLGLSFEVSYHARWMAPDTLVMSFAALTMLAVCSAQKSERPERWLKLGAVAAGLATGTKYPGGILLLPVMLAPFLHIGARRTLAGRTGWALSLALIFGLTYLFTTPATLIEPYAFKEQLQAVAKTYKEEGHAGHTIATGWPHLAAMGVYLSIVALSHYPLLAATLTAFMVLGVVTLLRGERRLALLLLPAPLAYLLYFSSARVMIVRNLMIVLPFMAIFAARGLGASVELLRTRVAPQRALIPAAAVAVFIFAANGAFLWRSQRSIVTKAETLPMASLAQYLDHSEESFVLSPRIARDLRDFDPKNTHGKVLAKGGPETPLVVYPKEIPNYMWKLPANRFGTYRFIPSGPFDVTWDYYPSWMDENRVLIMPTRTATAVGLYLPRTRTATEGLPRLPRPLTAARAHTATSSAR